MTTAFCLLLQLETMELRHLIGPPRTYDCVVVIACCTHLVAKKKSQNLVATIDIKVMTLSLVLVPLTKANR
jgi:hypothetical protein